MAPNRASATGIVQELRWDFVLICCNDTAQLAVEPERQTILFAKASESGHIRIQRCTRCGTFDAGERGKVEDGLIA